MFGAVYERSRAWYASWLMSSKAARRKSGGEVVTLAR